MPLEFRYVRGYPKKAAEMLRRFKRDTVKRSLIRRHRPRRHGRPWRYRTKADPNLLLEARAQQGIRGSVQERIFYKALVDRGFIPDTDFTFQSSQLGGRLELGGLVADFLFEVPRVIVQVQSSWHTMTLEHKMRDADQLMLLRHMGYTVLEIWPHTIEDQAALDWWMEQNVMLMWGISWQGLGRGNRAEHNYLNLLVDNSPRLFIDLLQMFKRIYELIME